MSSSPSTGNHWSTVQYNNAVYQVLFAAAAPAALFLFFFSFETVKVLVFGCIYIYTHMIYMAVQHRIFDYAIY